MLNSNELDEDLQVITTELCFLLRRYARTPHIALARQIYSDLLKLLPHLDQLAFIDNPCCFYKLLKSWQLRSLAQNHPRLEAVK